MRSRVSRTIDSARLSELVSRPGVDPRVWNEIGYVIKVFVDTTDDGAGVYADVHLARTATTDENGEVTAQVQTVRVGTLYAGTGFGLYLPLQPDDEVLISYPDGDPDSGGTIVARLHSPSDKPPQEAKDHPDDLILHVKKDANLRVLAFGSGNVVVGVENGKVLLGQESGTKPVARKGDKLTASKTMGTWASAVELAITNLGGTAPNPSFADGAGVDTAFGEIAEGSGKVEASD